MYVKFFKRFFDFSSALLGLLVISPMFVLITLVLFFRMMGSPSFFKRAPV